MLQSPESKYTPAAPPTTNYTPVKATSPMDQANIGRSLVIKGDSDRSARNADDRRYQSRTGRRQQLAELHHLPRIPEL